MFNAGDPFSALIGGRANGRTYFIMQSDENKQKIIKDIKQYKYSLTLAEILDSNNLTRSDFTELDFLEIINFYDNYKKVSKYRLTFVKNFDIIL